MKYRECLELIKKLCGPLEPIATGIEWRCSRSDSIKAVLFDIYGTLVVSGSGDVGTAREMSSSSSLQAALKDGRYIASEDAGEKGVALLNEEISNVHQQKRKKGAECPEVEIRDVWSAVVDKLKEAGSLTSAGNTSIELLAVSYECRSNPVWPMPNAIAVVDDLRRKGIRLGIVSNAQFYTPLMMEALFGGSPSDLGFDERICSWSFTVGQAKPAQEMFAAPLEFLAAAGVQAGEVLYVGNDMLNDVWTANRAGCRTALFAGDVRSLRLREGDSRCESLESDHVITDLSQLSGVVGEE
ncbi:MAG: HAD family hydrolase [Verrucomicrobia bacterium]|nr:HAD family hydrolase [Verrucomicrobiota bacterium]